VIPASGMARTQCLIPASGMVCTQTMFDSCKWIGAEGDNGQSLPEEGCDRVDKGGYCQLKGAQGDDG
jgi:hypothetical protein